MIAYNPQYLDNIDIFTKDEILVLDRLNEQVSLEDFVSNKSFVDKFGIDFIHTSAQIEGNTYDKIDTINLLEYGRTAGGKKYSDAKMILNLREAYDMLMRESVMPEITTLKDIHYIVSNEMIPNEERAVPRTREVLIKGSNYIPLATRTRLNEELNYMFNKVKEIENPYNKAIYIHNNLAYLQYFSDCNKRTARMMLNISLKSDGKMIYIPSEEQIKEYLSSIVSYYETGEHPEFKKHFIKSYENITNQIVSVKECKKNELDYSREKGIEAIDNTKQEHKNEAGIKKNNIARKRR